MLNGVTLRRRKESSHDNESCVLDVTMSDVEVEQEGVGEGKSGVRDKFGEVCN